MTSWWSLTLVNASRMANLTVLKHSCHIDTHSICSALTESNWTHWSHFYLSPCIWWNVIMVCSHFISHTTLTSFTAPDVWDVIWARGGCCPWRKRRHFAVLTPSESVKNDCFHQLPWKSPEILMLLWGHQGRVFKWSQDPRHVLWPRRTPPPTPTHPFQWNTESPVTPEWLDRF